MSSSAETDKMTAPQDISVPVDFKAKDFEREGELTCLNQPNTIMTRAPGGRFGESVDNPNA